MGRLESLRVVDPVLTNIARGYSNAEYIGTKLLPIVNVDKEGGQIPLFGKDAFKVYKTERALKAASNEANIEGFTTTAYSTAEHELAIPLDYREIQESILDLQKAATDKAMGALQLGLEKEIADIVQDLATYPSDNKETLTTNQFDDSGSDPVAIIESAKATLRSIIGKRPNVMVMGASVFDNLKSHSAITGLIKYSSLGIVTLDLLKQIFGIPNIYVGEAIYSDDGSTFSDIWGDNIILAYNTNPSGFATTPYEPSFGYVLRKNGHPYVDKYEGEGGKVTYIRATDNFAVKVLGAESAYLINDVLGS